MSVVNHSLLPKYQIELDVKRFMYLLKHFVELNPQCFFLNVISRSLRYHEVGSLLIMKHFAGR